MELKKRESFDYSVKDNGIFNFTIDDVDMKKRTVRVIANTAKYLDSQLDVCLIGAPKQSIKLMGPDSTGGPKIKFALDHDLTKRPGKITKLDEEEVTIKGVTYTCLCGEVYMSDNTLGNDTLVDYLDGKIDQHSIGFKYLDIDIYDPEAHGNSEDGKKWSAFKSQIINADEYEDLAKDAWDRRVIAVKNYQLFEFSGVGFGANPITPYLGQAKSLNIDKLLLNLDSHGKKMLSILKDGIVLDKETITCKSDAINMYKVMQMQQKSIIDNIFNRKSIQKYLAEEFGVKPTEKSKGITANSIKF
jgi:hypothetical protein